MRAPTELRSPAAVALILTAAALFFGGSAGDSSLPWLGGAAIVAAVVLAATRPWPGGLLALAPLAALAVWCAASIAWSIYPDRSWEYANRSLVYVAFALVGAFAAARIRELALGFAGLLGAVCVWALAGKVCPWLYEDYERIARLRAPVGYWNALALLGAIALPLGLWVATRWRVRGTLLVFGWIVAIGLTYSRGGAVVAVVVVVAWLILSRAWTDSLATLVAAGVPAAGLVAVAFALPGVTSDAQAHSVRVRDGLLFGLVLVAGAAIAAALTRLPPVEPVPAVRRAALALAVVVAAAALVVVGLNAGSWRDSFTSPTGSELPNTSARFGELGSNYRWGWWKQAWRGWEEHPVAGTGAGSFELTNLRYRSTSLDKTLEPHSLPLQFLSETGLVGFLLFLLAAGALLRAGRSRPGPELALALALPAYLLHGLIDVGWDYAAVSAPVFLAAGALAARPGEGRLSPPALLMAGGVALAVLCSLVVVWLGERWTGQAYEALDNPARAVELAERARSVDPLAVEPLFAQALAERTRAKPRYGEALGLLEEATRLQPHNKETWYQLGEFNFRVRHCPRTALAQLDRFTALDPQNRRNTEYDAALAEVNSGTPIC
jgi:tetratricopeptide (TPR) repeat protein